MSTPTSKLTATAQALMIGYNNWSAEEIMAPRAPNGTQRVLPASLNLPALDSTQYRDLLMSNIPLFKNMRFHVLSMIVDEKQSKVCVHAKSEADSVIGPFGNEYSMFLTMTEDHEQVVEVLEFVDSKYSDEFLVRLRAYYEDKKGE